MAGAARCVTTQRRANPKRYYVAPLVAQHLGRSGYAKITYQIVNRIHAMDTWMHAHADGICGLRYKREKMFAPLSCSTLASFQLFDNQLFRNLLFIHRYHLRCSSSASGYPRSGVTICRTARDHRSQNPFAGSPRQCPFRRR
jgi:hypothetical protein